MPITTTIDKERELTIHTVTGKPRFEEGMSTLRQFWENQPTKNTLWDFREVILGRLTYGEVKKIINYIRPQAGKRAGGKTSLVGSKDLVKGTNNLMVSYCGKNRLPFQIRAFRSIRKANKWLDQKDDFIK
jgi:hypothetical protein